jgi:hypothetical protein
VNSAGSRKLVGIGQRMIKGAAHVGFVIAVSGADTIRDVLEPVYSSLELEWNPETVGAVDQDLPGAGLADVEAALLGRIARDSDLDEIPLDAGTERLALDASIRFRSPERE